MKLKPYMLGAVTGCLSVCLLGAVTRQPTPTVKTFLDTPSSANFAALVSDESGSGSVILGTSPTITTPTISGAISLPDNTRQTFNPGANASGLNVGAHTANPDTPTNGDVYYNSTDNELRARINSSWVALGSGSGSGDVTAASSFGTDNRVIRSDGTGKGVQASGITLDDSNNLTGIGDVTADGLTLNDLTASRIVVTDGSKVLTSGAAAPSGAFVGTTDTQTLTAKTIDSADNTVILANAMLPTVQPGTAVETGDGALYFAVPASWNGRDITSVRAFVTTAGTTGTTDIQIARIRSGTPADVLSTKLTIDSGETTSDTADAAAVINTSNDDLATDDILRVDVDAVSGTAPEGLFIQIGTGT